MKTIVPNGVYKLTKPLANDTCDRVVVLKCSSLAAHFYSIAYLIDNEIVLSRTIQHNLTLAETQGFLTRETSEYLGKLSYQLTP